MNFKISELKPEDLNPNLASAFHQRIIEMINNFENELDEDHEVGARLVNFGQTIQFHIEDIGYYNPSLIVFHGTLSDGSSVQLIQHVTQISFLLVALPKLKKDEPARRIGFNLNSEED